MASGHAYGIFTSALVTLPPPAMSVHSSYDPYASPPRRYWYVVIAVEPTLAGAAHANATVGPFSSRSTAVTLRGAPGSVVVSLTVTLSPLLHDG